MSVPAKPVFGKYVTTLPTTETMLPLAGNVTTAMLVTAPLICAVRSIAVCVANPTATARAATLGAAGRTVMLTGGEGSEVPPGPFAVYLKLSPPEKPTPGV